MSEWAISQMNSNPKLLAASKLVLCALLLLPIFCGLKAVAKELEPAQSDYQTPTHHTKSVIRPLDKKTKLFAEPTFDDLFGLNKDGLLKRFPSPNFKHKANFSQITWHGTDVSSVLELRFKKGRVSQLRLSTHYGYPRPGTTSDVEVGKWLSAPVK